MMKFQISVYSANKIVKVLTSLVSGQWVDETHIQARYNDGFDISAETNGVVLVKRSYKNLVARLSVNLPEEFTEEKVREIFDEYLAEPGEKVKYKYDWFLYFTWFFRMFPVYAIIISTFIAIVGLLSFKGAFLAAWLSIIFSRIAGFITSRLSKNRFACSELITVLAKRFGIDFLINKPEASTPGYIKNICLFSAQGAWDIDFINFGTAGVKK